MTFFRHLRSAALAALAALATLATTVLAQNLPIVYGEPAKAEKAAPEAKLHLAARITGPQVKLGPVTDEDIEKVRAENSRGRKGSDLRSAESRRVAIGIERPLETRDAASGARGLDWTRVDGGFAARLSATSPDAPAMRVALDLLDVPTTTEMVFFGSAAPDKLFGPYRVGDVADRTNAWWSPVTIGDTLTVEFFVPSPARAEGSDARIANVAHLFANPALRTSDKRLQDIGDSGACNVDVPCSALRSSSAFQNAVSSVAQMVFNDTQFTYLCTGTLLNDTDASTQKPYLFSANHCFDSETTPRTASQLQTIANTLTTLWFFEAAACGSASPNPNWQQVGGGATYLYSNPTSDALFIRLNNAPPAGAFFSGWDPNPISVGANDIDIHHPEGDLKKVSQGSVVSFARWDSSTPSNSYIENLWSSGTTEGGSSGSALLTLSNGQYVVRGGLRGGSALCTNTSGTDFFSRFDQIYPNISQYLAVSSGPAPIANVTSLWWIPAESGWGLNLIHHSGTNIVFGTWYTYGQDGKRTWLVMPEAHWTSSTTFSGPLYTASGPRFDQPYDASQHSLVQVGTGTLTLSDANNGTWSWTANGLSGTKAVRRFVF